MEPFFVTFRELQPVRRRHEMDGLGMNEMLLFEGDVGGEESKMFLEEIWRTRENLM